MSNASSLSDSILQVSGVALTTKVNLIGNSDINIGFANTTTAAAAAVSVTLTDAGSMPTATTLASASAAATATLDLDLADAGLISSVNVSLAGTTDFARLEAGSGVKTYTLSGAANGVLVTDDTVTSFDASALTGKVDITFSGMSDAVAKGGAGNDTFRFSTTYNNNDSVEGGAGNDTISATFGGFNRNLNTTNVETANLTFADDAGGTVNATASTVATYNIIASSAGADGSLAGVANAAVINIASDNLDDVSVGYISSASVATLNIGSASGTVGIDAIGVSGVSSVTLNISGGTGGAGSAGAITLDGAQSVSINNLGGESDFSASDLIANAAASVTITSNGSASIAFTSALEAATGITTLTLSANGSDAADITLGTLSSATADKLTTISLSGVSGADVTVGAVKLGNGITGAAAGSISLTTGNGSIVGTSAADVTTTGAYSLSLSLDAQASGTVNLSDIVMNAGTAATAASTGISLTVAPVTVGANGLVRVEKIALDGATAGAQVNIGAVNVGTSAGFIFAASGIWATAIANVDVSDINVTLGADASATFGTILTTGGAVGNISLTVADSASGALGVINASAIGTIGTTVVGDGAVSIAGLTAVSNVGAITLSIADEGDVTIAAISAGGDVGNITIGNGASGTANFDTIGASSIGNITVSGAGYVDFGLLSATRVGTIDTTQMTSGTFNINLTAVTNAAEVKLGAGTNTVISGVGNDVITLKAGVTGNDFIQFAIATQGTDNIINFGAGTTGGDVIVIGGTGMGLINGSGGVASADKDASLKVMVSGTATMAAASNIIVLTRAAASTAAMVNQLSAGAAFASGLASGATYDVMVVWTDGADSYLTIVTVGTTGASGTTTAFASAASVTAGGTLAVLQGVTPGALVAANFDFS